MKNLIKYLSVLVIVLSFASCEEESNFQDPSIELVPVYAITNIQGEDAPFRINIYRQQDLIIEYSSSVNATGFASSSYMDSSSEANYNISVDKITEDATMSYVITADRITGEGTLTIDATIEYDIIISEEQVYN